MQGGHCVDVVIWITILAFAISSSIDNFGVGLSYGISKLEIGFLSNFIISVIAFTFSEIGIHAGQFLSTFFPGIVSKLIAALVLCIIGIRILFLTIPRKGEATEEGNIFQKPEKADLDHSGNINLVEAIILGVVVSLNALTNGLSAGLMKLSPFAISLATAVFSYLAIWGGCVLGGKIATIRIGSLTIAQFSNVISGIILVLIGLHTLL